MKKIILLGIAVGLILGCSALGIQGKVEETRQKALEQLMKAACADPKETVAFVKGSKLEAVDWAAVCK